MGLLRKIVKIVCIFGFIILYKVGSAQYLSNPSFEGYSSLGIPPPGWNACDDCSTVDTEPGNLQNLIASDGNTYIGMTGRGPYSNPDCTETCEVCQTTLLLPLSPDSCYTFSVDLAFNPACSWGGHNYFNPLKLDIWASNESCFQDEFLWSSPTPGINWNTYTFSITPSFEITHLILQSNYTQAFSHWGNIMVDNILVENSAVQINLGNDTVLCYGEILVLDAGSGFSDYLWSDGSIGQSIEVVESGEYWVEASAGICSSSDTINVEVLPPIVINIGNDTTLCSSQFELDAGEGYEMYQWNTGDIEQSISISDSGLYFVTVTDQYGCEGTDSINISFEYDEIDIGLDTVLCVGEELILDAGEGFEEYLWNTGSILSAILVDTSGFYWVVATSEFGCQAVDTIEVSFEEETFVSLGNDTTLCSGALLVLSPGLYNQYEWQDGSNNSELIISQEGEYWVKVLGGCNWDSDTISIEYFSPVFPDLGNDTTLCFGDDYYLYPGVYMSYLWQNGSVASSFPVDETGYYSVVVTDINECEGEDEVFVRVGMPINLNPDTTICQGESVLIEIGNDYDYFEWSTNDTTSFIYIDSAGVYSITAGLDIPDCEFTDSIEVVLTPVPFINIPDTSLCMGDTLLIGIEEDESFLYYWNEEAGGFQYRIANSGQNIVSVGNMCGISIDTFNVVSYPKPEVELFATQNYLWNEDEEARLELENTYESYIWQDGSEESQYIVSFEEAVSQNLYSVEVSNGHCKGSDSIIIESVQFKIPPFISPNGDGINDRFEPKNWIGINNHKIIVLNRWGQTVWESNDFLPGWDGRDQSKQLVPDGTYYWILQLSYDDNISRVFKGSLTVLNGIK